MPKEIVFVDSIPKTPVGKILRRELKDIVAKEEAPAKQEAEGQKSEINLDGYHTKKEALGSPFFVVFSMY